MNVNNELQWHDVDVEGESTKSRYFGRFQIKPFLTHGERADATRLADRYARGIENETQRLFLLTLAFIKFHVVESDAPWWKDDGLTLYDEAPIYSLAEIVGKAQGLKDETTEVADEQK